MLEADRFEFFLMSDPSKCLILLENLAFTCYDPNICILFSHLASQYGIKHISIQALRTYLKIILNGSQDGNVFYQMEISLLSRDFFYKIYKKAKTIFKKFQHIEKFCKKQMMKRNL